MATSLTTRRMHPALAERIESSVRGRCTGIRAGQSRLVSLARVMAIALVIAAIGSVLSVRRRERRAFQDARAALLERVRARASALTDGDRDTVRKSKEWLARSAGPYEGDFVGSELRTAGAIATQLAREVVYVRMPLSVASDATSVAGGAAVSYKDALLFCLVSPPDSRTEKALLGRVRAAYAGAALAERTAHVHRLDDAERGLPLLLPDYVSRIEKVETLDEISALDARFNKAPIEEATRALRGALLIFALDEQGSGHGPTELDGERPHDVRVHFVDLLSNTMLLRVRRRVDPGAISDATRAMYAAGIDSCSLAVDVLGGLRDPHAAKSD